MIQILYENTAYDVANPPTGTGRAQLRLAADGAETLVDCESVASAAQYGAALLAEYERRWLEALPGVPRSFYLSQALEAVPRPVPAQAAKSTARTRGRRRP